MHRTISFYVVQKCWFSGPDVFDPIDCQRLFVTPESAQVVAYQSAHALCNQQQPVRTVHMLHSYGFAVAGALLWIRPVSATVVGSYSMMMNQNDYQAQTICYQETVGDSRRRVQLPADSSCWVFVGDGALTAAQEAVVTNNYDHCHIRSIPIGSAPAAGWRHEWPVSAKIATEEVIDNGKRTSMDDSMEHDTTMRGWTTVTEQSAKRRCTGSPTIAHAMDLA